MLFRVYILLGLLYTTLLGQISSQTKKLVAFTKEVEVIADGVLINGELFFALNQVDSATTPPYKTSYIVKVDSGNNVVAMKGITPGNVQFTEINRLFPLTHPITGEKVIGFLGGGVRLNPGDSTFFSFMGYVTTDFSEVKFYDNFFEQNVTAANTNGYSLFYPSYQNDIYILNDTSFLYFEDTSLVKIVYDSSGFYIADSITDVIPFGIGSKYHFFKFSNSPVLIIHSYFSPTPPNPHHLLYKEIVLSSSILGLSLSKVIFSNFRTGDFTLSSYNDTLFLQSAYSSTSFSQPYICKFIYDGSGSITLIDSLLLDSIPYLFGAGGRTFSHLSYPNLYLFTNDHETDFYNPGIPSLEWIHYSVPRNTYIVIDCINVSSLLPQWRFRLGGDAFYQLNGVLSPGDSVAFLYGWEFPLGDTTRTDGDAFIWKISWNSGIVTSVLGDAPEYVFKVFPNPASERLQVQGKTKHATTLLLRSTNGKELLRKEFSAETTLRELDVSNLSKGIYLLEIQTSSGRKFTEKVVIE